MKGYVYISLIKEKFEKLPDLSKNKNELAGTSTSSVTADSGNEIV